MPRAILKYDVTPDTMIYGSYSEGVNPGGFNTSFLTGSASLARTAQALGYSIETQPETLHNYEIGLKGKLFDNRVRYSLSAYYAIWNNQLNQQNIAGNDPSTGQPVVVQVTTNTGRVRMSGIEGDVSSSITPELSFDVSGALNNSYILAFSQATLTQLTGETNFRGKQNPETPKYSGAASLQYKRAIPGLDGVDCYFRADYTIKSGVYSDQSNLVHTPMLDMVNFRLGMSTDKVTFEGFVTNAFNNRSPTSAVDGTLYNSSFSYTSYSSALVLGLPDLRTFGVRVKYKF